MSIEPRIVDRTKNEYVKIHMRVNNIFSERIDGIIHIKIFSPQNELAFELIRNVSVRLILDSNFYIETNKLELGKYIVKGSFIYHGEEFVSETKNSDHFEVIN